MSGLRRALLALGTGGLLSGVVVALVIGSSSHVEYRALETVIAERLGKGRPHIELAGVPTEAAHQLGDGGGKGTGLRGLSDRVAGLGGKLEVESPPGAGTRVRATIPLGS